MQEPGYGTQPYAPQYQMQKPQPYQASSTPPDQPKSEFGDRSNKLAPPKPRWNDLFFNLLFWAQFAGFIAVAVISLRALAKDTGTLGGDDDGITLNLSSAYMFALIAAAGFVFAILYLAMVRAFTTIIFEITLALSVLLSVGYAAYLWYVKYWSGAIIFTIFAVMSVLAYPFMRRRIPFSKAVLLTVMQVANDNKAATYGVAILGCLIQTIYSIFWSFVAAASYQKWNPDTTAGQSTSGGSGSGALIVVCIFLVFSFYWTSQVLENVLLCTEAGVFGAWYFAVNSSKLSHPALGAFKRAMTYSFGSIAFGSLIVALLDMIRAALNLLKNQEASSGDTIAYIFTVIADCCLMCIQGLVQFFNRYAYIEIALFGKGYIPAAKDAWHLLKDRGVDALVNDCLVNNIWTIGSYVVGTLCSLFAYLYVHIANPGFAQDGSSIVAAILLYAFLIGFFICHTLGFSALSAGVSTVFVGLAEEPGALQQKSPMLYQEIVRTYPHVLQPV